jgi:diaminohydroxyphosphoribosylaminopyrimidine deaminase / 5-amino-6-(5-phosphoribosylamino)uracil reductase
MYEASMQRALELALLGPAHGVNPQVGCVIVDAAGQIIGEGFHQGAGTDHAEVVALKNALGTKKRLDAGSTAVVTLEPCNHTGRTGPCAKALIDAGVEKVVFASFDPGVVSSGGAKTLQEAGIEVIPGVLQEVADFQNRVWLSATKKQLPFVTLKWASSLDGRIAASDGTSKWISGAESRAHAHDLRSKVDAILVGTGTVMVDDPELTARKTDGSLYEHQPLRVILGEREIDGQKKVFNGSAETIQIRSRSIHGVLGELYARGVKHLLVEGGPTIASHFLKLDLVDEVLVYLAPKLLGGEKLAIDSIGVSTISEAKDLELLSVERLGPDILVSYKPGRAA